MKIIIDTKEDSPEEIRKAIQILSGFGEPRKERHEDIFNSTAEKPESAPSLFDAKTEQSVFGAMFATPDIENKPKKQRTEEEIRIIPY